MITTRFPPRNQTLYHIYYRHSQAAASRLRGGIAAPHASAVSLREPRQSSTLLVRFLLFLTCFFASLFAFFGRLRAARPLAQVNGRKIVAQIFHSCYKNARRRNRLLAWNIITLCFCSDIITVIQTNRHIFQPIRLSARLLRYPYLPQLWGIVRSPHQTSLRIREQEHSVIHRYTTHTFQCPPPLSRRRTSLFHRPLQRYWTIRLCRPASRACRLQNSTDTRIVTGWRLTKRQWIIL